MPKVSSETHMLPVQKTASGWENTWHASLASETHSAAAAACSKDSPRMGKHHGSEGRRSLKIAPQKSLTELLKPTCCLFIVLLLLPVQKKSLKIAPQKSLT